MMMMKIIKTMIKMKTMMTLKMGVKDEDYDDVNYDSEDNFFSMRRRRRRRRRRRISSACGYRSRDSILSL